MLKPAIESWLVVEDQRSSAELERSTISFSLFTSWFLQKYFTVNWHQLRVIPNAYLASKSWSRASASFLGISGRGKAEGGHGSKSRGEPHDLESRGGYHTSAPGQVIVVVCNAQERVCAMGSKWAGQDEFEVLSPFLFKIK